MKLYIKNMVSHRCKMVVKDEMEKLGFADAIVDLGEVEIKGDITSAQYSQLSRTLELLGFALLEDRKHIIVQQVKDALIEVVHHTEEPLVYNLSVFISKKVGYDYTYLSNLFSDQLGITIEKFYIRNRIERVKELLTYDELTLTEIAFKMRYSSVAHLSSQFKKVTGLTPSEFKRKKDKGRSSLEDL